MPENANCVSHRPVVAFQLIAVAVQLFYVPRMCASGQVCALVHAEKNKRARKKQRLNQGVRCDAGISFSCGFFLSSNQACSTANYLCFHPEIVIVIYVMVLLVDRRAIARPTALAARAIVDEIASGKKLQPLICAALSSVLLVAIQLP